MKYFFLISAFLFHFGCGGFDDRPEDIAKVRGLGMSANPLVSTPSTSSNLKIVTLTIYVAMPSNQTVTLAKYQDQEATSALLLDESQYDIVSGSEVYTQYNGIKVLNFQATASVPTAEELPAIGGNVRVGFEIKGPKNVERFIANFPVVPASNTTFLAYKTPTVTIQTPQQGASLNSDDTVNVVASVGNPNNEDLKAGWFVSAGDITNRRSINTYWDTPGPGKNTLIVTIRGETSLGFAMQVIDLTIK